MLFELYALSLWIMKAAAQGFVPAFSFVGDAYANGDGVKQDREKALQWFMKAAEQGDAQAKQILELALGRSKEQTINKQRVNE
jgi:uncharacterized protein